MDAEITLDHDTNNIAYTISAWVFGGPLLGSMSQSRPNQYFLTEKKGKYYLRVVTDDVSQSKEIDFIDFEEDYFLIKEERFNFKFIFN